MPALAGVTPQGWHAGISRVGPLFNVGRLTKTEGFGQILRECGADGGYRGGSVAGRSRGHSLGVSLP
jgi:hypothetical protein